MSHELVDKFSQTLTTQLHQLSNFITNETKTDYESVKEFNNAFGIPTHDTPQLDIFEKDTKTVDYRLSLINEEVKELNDAIKNKDMVETIDALADIIYVVQGMGSSFGLDLDKAFDIVHKSNMSKLCKTEDEAKQTVEYYKQHPELGYTTPNYRLANDNVNYVVFNESTKKILKSINYTPTNFSSILTI